MSRAYPSRSRSSRPSLPSPPSRKPHPGVGWPLRIARILGLTAATLAAVPGTGISQGPPTARPGPVVPWHAPYIPSATSGSGSTVTPGSPAGLSDTSRVRRWREDLGFISDRVQRLHPRPFASLSEAAFDSAARSIERSIPETDDARLAVECMRMVAALGDGHTMVIGTLPPLGFDSTLPVWLRPFEDGLYVAAADSALVGVVGAKVLRIGEVSADEAVARVGSITSADNGYSRLDRIPLFLMIPGALNALGIAPRRDRVTLEIGRPGGGREKIEVAGGVPPPGFPELFLETEPRLPPGWMSARCANGTGLPRCDWRPEDAWWFEYLAYSRLLYVRMRRIDPIVSQRANPDNYRPFYVRLLALADSLRPAALVVDLRHNHGGNNTILDPLIRGIVQRPWLDREGGLFALIDRGTFSAAMNAAVFLENQTRVRFVGEPTGGRVNHYGDAPEFQTPNLGMMVQVSTLPWLSRYPQDDRPWIAPDIATPSTFAAWREGRDEALEAVIDAVRSGTREQRMLAASHRGGPEAAAAAFNEWNRLHPNPWAEGPAMELYDSMSALMDQGAWADAAALGEALVRLEPGTAWVWRVLGEAQLHAGQRDRAVEALRETIRLNPRAQVARVMLQQLGEEP